MKPTALNIAQGTIQDVRFMHEPAKTESVIDRIFKFFDQATQSSLEAWENSGKTEQQ